MDKKAVTVHIEKKIHTRLKLLSIARDIPMWKVVEEFMRMGLEHESNLLEEELQGRIRGKQEDTE